MPPVFSPEVEKFGKKEAREPVLEEEILKGLSSDQKKIAEEYRNKYPDKSKIDIDMVLGDQDRKKEFLREISTIEIMVKGAKNPESITNLDNPKSTLFKTFAKYGIISHEQLKKTEEADQFENQGEIAKIKEKMEDIWGPEKSRKSAAQSALDWDRGSRIPPSAVPH